MARIIYNPRIDPNHLPPARLVKMADLGQLETALDQLRNEWQEAAGGDLSRVQGVDIAALLDDITRIVRGRKE